MAEGLDERICLVLALSENFEVLGDAFGSLMVTLFRFAP
jgi:hypothetical protein